MVGFFKCNLKSRHCSMSHDASSISRNEEELLPLSSDRMMGWGGRLQGVKKSKLNTTMRLL